MLTTVTLGIKNLVGLYPGTIYNTVRAGVHDHAADADSPGVAFEIIDMMRTNKLGLVVVDVQRPWKATAPVMGNLYRWTSSSPAPTPASMMGFKPGKIPTFVWANKAGMQPQSLDEIEVRSEKVSNVRQRFARPQLPAWNDIRSVWGVQEIP